MATRCHTIESVLCMLRVVNVSSYFSYNVPDQIGGTGGGGAKYPVCVSLAHMRGSNPTIVGPPQQYNTPPPSHQFNLERFKRKINVTCILYLNVVIIEAMHDIQNSFLPMSPRGSSGLTFLMGGQKTNT